MKHAKRSLNHLVGSQQEFFGNRDAERLGGPEVDDQLELGGLLDGQIRGFGTFKNLVDIRRASPSQIGPISPIGHQAAFGHEFLVAEYRRQPVGKVKSVMSFFWLPFKALGDT
jgi:hypothetical protein